MGSVTSLLACVFLLAWVIDRVLLNNRRDTTDLPKGKRSGMIIRTDYGTGVQYLEGMFGGLTVRLDTDGKPVVADRFRK